MVKTIFERLTIRQKVFLVALIWGTVWGIVSTNFSEVIELQHPLIQFVLVSLIPISIFSILISLIFSDKPKFSLKKAAGSFLMLIAYDLFVSSPFLLRTNGVINSDLMFAKGTAEYLIIKAYSLLGFEGLGLWLFVYPVSFVVLFVIMALLVSERDLKEIIKFN